MSPHAATRVGDAERWHRANNAHLAAALTWLRIRVQRLGGPAPTPAAPGATPDRWRMFRRRRLALPTASGLGATDLRAAHQAMLDAERSTSASPALRLIGERFGLSTFERHVLLLCASVELDTGIADLLAQAHGHPHPTLGLAMALFDEATWDVRSPERPLRYWRLIEIDRSAGQPLTSSPLRADERIVNALKGLTHLDERIGALMLPLDLAAPEVLPPSQKTVVDTAIGYLKRDHGHSWPILQLVGSDRASSRLVAQHLADALELVLYQLSSEAIPTQNADLDSLARLWQRESLLAPVALYIDAMDLEPTAPAHTALARFLTRTDGIVMLAMHEPWTRLSRTTHLLDVARPTSREQRDAWRALLEGTPEVRPDDLAAQFDLDLPAVRQVVHEALHHEGERAMQDRLWSACRRVSRPRLERLAQRVDAKATWDRLVLPEPQLRLLRSIADQVTQRSTVYDTWGFADAMNRGLGISALFSGESGTGKTMAAEVIANELRLDLYRIDLSSVVSKYIGETEKNLRSLFDAAENGGAILFFDEADALFGKRSEVKDAHDRYANIEVNYLLQRMEAYQGLAILATNMKSALDSAFVRRLRFIVDFPFPSADDRHRMWQHVFPIQTPTETLDLARLAKLNLTGANIHQAALNAAFIAVHRGIPVGMPEVLEAARNELRKLERPINEADFRWEPKGAPA